MNKSENTKRNKVLISMGLVVASAIYGFSQYLIDSPSTIASAVASSQQTQSTSKVSAPQGLYADGTYTGSVAGAYYGQVQVQAVIKNGALADVQFLQYPNTHSTSLSINGTAMSILKSEAIQAQSANVNIVSGATDTSQAFQQSLQSALSQAQA